MNNVVLTKATFFRNVKDYKFVPKLTSQQKEEIKQKVSDAYQNKLENVSVNLFDTEHISVYCFDDGSTFNSFNKAKQVANEISNKISMSYSDEFGYLTSDLTHLGAGLKLDCDICLNSIVSINKLDQVKSNLRKLGYTLKETNLPKIFELSTTCNLGFSESEIFENFKTTVQKLQELETESAKIYDLSNHEEIVDKANRALAILTSCNLIRSDELNSHLVTIRTALNLGILDIDENKIVALQRLAINSTKDIVSVTDLKVLANETRKILKGE